MSEPWRPPRDITGPLLDELRRLQRDRPGDDEPGGTGEALDGRVRVAVSGGRISEVVLDPRAMRLPSEDLAAAFRDAANAAMDSQRERLTAGLPAMPSVDELARTLTEINADSMRAMEESGQGIRDAIAAVQRVSELHRRSTGE